MNGSQAAWLDGGKRLHLHHGPIDLIVYIDGTGAAAAYAKARTRFASVLTELARELPRLREPAHDCTTFDGTIANRMQTAVAPHARQFVTPMAAVAGAVADEILAEIAVCPDVVRAYVNNGGDTAVHLTSAAPRLRAAIAGVPGGRVTLGWSKPVRGIATSGWRGRSYSFGIADAVTVLATNTAAADVAATLIANAVDLPGSAQVTRVAANALSHDSDLGDRLVTTHVQPLTNTEVATALARGVKAAQTMIARKLISSALLQLQDAIEVAGSIDAFDMHCAHPNAYLPRNHATSIRTPL
ncbi:MAG: UPF0280 family protein [Pseudomonadota bacterium]